MKGGHLEEQRRLLSSQLADPESRRSNMLNAVCGPDTKGNCLDFGPYVDLVEDYFEHFTNMSLIVISEVKKLTEGNNGFVLELPFHKNRFNSYSVMKCMINSESDNIMYEYAVGKHFINEMSVKLPCFLKSYGMYNYVQSITGVSSSGFNNATIMYSLSNHITKYGIQTSYRNRIQTIFQSLVNVSNVEEDEYLKKSCLNSPFMCLQIQHFKNFKPLGDTWRTNYEIIKYDIYNLLYQVYFALGVLSNVYTHYDLHSGNIGLYKPYREKCYMTYHYHYNDGSIIEFPCEYIVKIIDYGRNYFNNVRTGMTSTRLIQKVCSLSECNPDCGNDVGYSQIHGEKTPGSFYHIDPRIPNCSHDLLTCVAEFDNILIGTNRVCDEIVYKRVPAPDFTFGTPAIEQKTFTATNKVVSNVADMSEALRQFIPRFNVNKLHLKYDSTWKKKGDMHIYENLTPYEFIASPAT